MAMRIEDLMKRNPECAHENENIQQAAKRMRDQNIGFLPVCDQSMRPIGTLTDRDITIRAVANDNRPSETRVGEVMTREVVACRLGDDIKDAERLMGEHQKSRVMVCDESGRLVGVVSLSDIIEQDSGRRAVATLREIAARESRL